MSSRRSAPSRSRVGTRRSTRPALKTTGYPPKANLAEVNWVMAELLLVIMVIYVMSLPYHIGNGWFGGMLPLLATAMVAAAGNIYYGLWYPVWVSVMTFVIGILFVWETKDVRIHAEH